MTEDEKVGAFLAFLELDMIVRPESVKELPLELVESLRVALADMEVDLDAPIEGEVVI